MRARAWVPAVMLLIAPSSAAASVVHVIAPGESLSSIAAEDGLTVEQLAAANGLSPNAELIAGATIEIPQRGGAAPEPLTAATYLVRPGDTLSGIAARVGVSVASLAALNGLDPAGILPSGARLRIPGRRPLQEPARATGPPYPTDEQLSMAEIGSIAAANGVPPALAEAVAWQESGFNNDMVSNADARGVMQIIPSTWSWIVENLAPQPPLQAASAADNVRGGVLLLRSLLAAAGSTSRAVGAYYQGLRSVQKIGLLPETQRYVRDVLALARRFGGT